MGWPQPPLLWRLLLLSFPPDRAQERPVPRTRQVWCTSGSVVCPARNQAYPDRGEVRPSVFLLSLHYELRPVASGQKKHPNIQDRTRDSTQGTCPRPIHCPGRRGAPTDHGAQQATAHSTLTDTRTHSHVRPRTCHTDTHRHTETHPLPHRPHAHAPGHMLTCSYTWTHTDTDTGHRTHEHTGP